MSLEITNVINAFENRDFGRPNLFEIEIPYADGKLQFKAKASSVPSGDVGSIEVGYLNRKYKVAGDRTFGDWSITVYNDNESKNHDAFLKWQSEIQTFGRESSGAPPAAYMKIGTVWRLDREGNRIKEYEMQEIWPTTVGELSLDWDSNDQVETFDVTFALNSWEGK